MTGANFATAAAAVVARRHEATATVPEYAMLARQALIQWSKSLAAMGSPQHLGQLTGASTVMVACKSVLPTGSAMRASLAGPM